ncbi:hypothetical protein ACVILH_003580 [Bradyrhizobium sp. USDA 4353]
MLKVTPVIDSVDLPFSLNVSFSVSPLSRLTPLNEASDAVRLICVSTLLYCATRFARCVCAVASATGAAAVRPLKAWLEPAAVPLIAPIVAEAASLVVEIEILPVEESIEAWRLLAASAVFKSFSELTCPVPSPNVMLVAVPPPVAPIVSVLPAKPSPTALSPSLAKVPLLPESVNPAAGGVRVIAPAVIDELTPVAVWIADSRFDTVSPMPMLVPVEDVPVTKLKVVPLTTSVSPEVMPVARSFDEVPAVPDSLVLPVIATAVVLSFSTAVPVTAVLLAPNRLVAVAPVRAVEVTLDLVE